MNLKKTLYDLVIPVVSEYLQGEEINIIFESPKFESQGDFSSNVAMLISKKIKKNPREIANDIVNKITGKSEVIEKIEIAGPGFINFFFKPSLIPRVLPEIINRGESYGKSNKYSGKRANVEFVSANPTGPLTVGHGRNAISGDTIASLLEQVGYTVDREYYFNNAGRQMRVLGDSVRLRYLNLLGLNLPFPEDYYQGEYINEIAIKLKNEFGDSLKDEPAEGKFKEAAESSIFLDIKNTLSSLRIHHSVFYNENSLYEDGRIKNLLEHFRSQNLSYESDGAIWLKLSELGNEKDKVIVKSSGEPTYRLPDIAYHITKFERGYDLIVDLFGSDHNATYPDVLAALKVLGYDTSKVKVLIHQFVTIMRGNEVVKMSTRKANYVTLDELVAETSADVVRYFFNMRSITTHLNFDLAVAKKQSDENPVFYLQYAHARICSILRMAEEQGLTPDIKSLHLLITKEEQQLIKKLGIFEDEVVFAAEQFEPNRITTYLEELAALFHRFYTVCRVIGVEKELAAARLSLCIAVKIVIANGLRILGVTAPERMNKLTQQEQENIT